MSESFYKHFLFIRFVSELYMIKFKIGKVPIRKQGVLAPILEFSTLPYRELSRIHNCGLCYTEMIHTNHLVNISEDELFQEELLKSTKEDTHTSCQLIGDFTNKKTTIDAVSIIDNHKYFDIIDLNFGCPSQRIISGKSGSGLLKDIPRVIPVIKEICEITTKPVTIKTRLGFTKNEIEFISKEFIKTGIDALAIHARCAKDSYAVPAKPDQVRKIKKETTIPIIYNGDVNEANYKYFLDFDGIMVARSALGNPGIFDLINRNKGTITKEDKQLALFEFLELLEKHPISFQKLKISILPFIKGTPKSSVLRDKISKAKTISEIRDILPKE